MDRGSEYESEYKKRARDEVFAAGEAKRKGTILVSFS